MTPRWVFIVLWVVLLLFCLWATRGNVYIANH